MALFQCCILNMLWGKCFRFIWPVTNWFIDYRAQCGLSFPTVYLPWISKPATWLWNHITSPKQTIIDITEVGLKIFDNLITSWPSFTKTVLGEQPWLERQKQFHAPRINYANACVSGNCHVHKGKPQIGLVIIKIAQVKRISIWWFRM